ncbi:MAG TPA: ATP-binding protein [Tepidisphaeraceae bacterium]
MQGEWLDNFLYLLAALLQLAAMIFAIRMVREVNDRRPWYLLFAALFIMFVMRLIAIFVSPEIRVHLGPFVALPISLLLFISLFSIRKIAATERESTLAAARNATERDESEHRYRSLVELSPDVLFVIVAGRITYVNAAALKFFRAKQAEDLVGHSPMDFIAPRSKPIAEGRIADLMSKGGSVPPIEEDWLRPDGSSVPVETSAALVPWRGGFGIQVILRDISERKRAEEEKSQLLSSERAARSNAERASRMKDEFLATLSHELRTPLNAILGWSQLLLQGTRHEEDITQGLTTIERNARAQTQLIEDLLDLSRIISGKLRLDIQRVLPITFIEAAIDAVRPAADAKGIRLERMLDPLAGPVSGDPNRLQQVIWNLLSNAIKFTPKGGKVQVVLERVNSHVEITVADTGQGIAAEFLPYVFDRFRQADATTTRKQSGLGIGLAIVKQMVDLHGGSVTVSSPGEKRGASFVVHLPLTVIHAQSDEVARLHPHTAIGTGESAPMKLAGIKVLVVDDEPDARDLIRRVLEDCQAQVLTAASAAEAMSLLNAEKPHVLVSDIGMPETDGYEFLRQVRLLSNQNGGKIPAIALTAFARSEDRTRALMSGYQVHVAKPVEPAELVATVASVVGRTGESAGEN